VNSILHLDPIRRSAGAVGTIAPLRYQALQSHAAGGAGSTVFELQAIGGHKTLSELQKYVAKCDKRAAADRSAEKLALYHATPPKRRRTAA
jgi:hypothetical protein